MTTKRGEKKKKKRGEPGLYNSAAKRGRERDSSIRTC